MKYIYLDEEKQWFVTEGALYLYLFHEPCSEFNNKGRGKVGYVQREHKGFTYHSDQPILPGASKITYIWACSVCKKTPTKEVDKKYNFLNKAYETKLR